jgi:hypothetical protein
MGTVWAMTEIGTGICAYPGACPCHSIMLVRLDISRSYQRLAVDKVYKYMHAFNGGVQL